MPLPTYTIDVPLPGYVDIHYDSMRMRFDKQGLDVAIANTKAKRNKYETEQAYQFILGMYESALKVLEAENE